MSFVYSNLLYADPEIEITGLDSTQEDNVRAYLLLTDEPCDAPQWKIKRLFTQASLQNINESGHQFVSSLSLSLKKSNLVMEYILPLSNPLKDRLSFFSGISYEDTVNINSARFDLGVRLWD